MPSATLQLQSSGSPVVLTAELTRIGRGKQCEFVAPTQGLGREHSLIVRRASGFWICDLNSSSGTWVARRGAKPARIGSSVVRLEDGDVIDINCPMRFHADPENLLEQELASDLAAHPSDARRWHAYAAYLAASGDPRGRRIELSSTELWWPGSALTSPELRLELDWAHGHVRRATLQELRHSGYQLLQTLRALLWAPATEFVTELDISLLPAPQRINPCASAHDIIEYARSALASSRLPALRHLHLSPPLDAPGLVLANSPLLSD